MSTIMIVDDSRIMRNTVKGIFSNLGLACLFVEAGDGNEALSILGMGPAVDLILLDWNMPNLSGIDFLKKVRAIGQYRKIPIIMVTSESAKFNVIEALKSGANDYITKPVTVEVFREKLSKLSKLGL